MNDVTGVHWNWWLWGLAAVLAFWGIGAYNRVMLLRNEIGKAYAQLDDALMRRFAHGDLLLERLRERLPSEQASLDALAAAQVEAKAAAQAVRARPYAADPVAHLAVAAAARSGPRRPPSRTSSPPAWPSPACCGR